jgi:class 3 adenylate cyclase/tetratricopeptide (TPR) repeat protein
MAACPRCGEENPDRARFCLACGTPLQARPAAGEARKTVTVLFADVKDSTPLGERLDPEAARGVMNRFFADVRAVIERHGGTVEKFIGDAVMAVFGTPTVHEDDPLRAVRAATEMRTELAELNSELEERWGIHLSIRTGINTGKVVAGDPATGSTFVTGDAVNVGARLESAAGPGEILIGDATYRLVRDAVLVEPVEPLDLKGKAEPMTAWRVLGVVTGAPSVARRLDSAIVGRERELTMLRHAFERAAADETCQLVTILGPAGAGKSRLATELLNEVDDSATILVGRCLPYGEGITFWPVVEIVKRAAGLGPALSTAESRRRLASIVADDAEAEVIVDTLGALLGLWRGPSATDEIFWAVRRMLQAVARTRPVVVLFDDVHWGEPTFLDLIDHVADWARDVPILLMCLARAELLEERPMWAGGKLNATSLLLEPLANEACGTLIENLLELTVADDVKERIARAAEGNPLFVEELLAMLIDDGALRREGGRWVASADLSSLAVPPTIQALLDARLDRLAAAERRVIERAAIAGRIFSRSAVRVLSPPGEHDSLDELLADLVRKQLIRPHQAEFGRENTYRFRHSLIRDAAYRQMPKATRADLHERFAGWLERASGPRSAEQEEILGYHLEQAHRYRRELDGPTGATGTLARRGAACLTSAGRRAFSRGDMAAAAGLLTRAQLLVADDDAASLELAPDLGTALIETGQLERADAVLSRAIEQAAAGRNERIEALAELERSFLRLHTNADCTTEELLETATRALRVFERIGDDAGIAKSWKFVALLHWIHCRLAEMEAVLERSLEHARRAGDERELSIVRNSLARAALLGPRPVSDALRVCAQLRAEAPTDRALEGIVCAVEGALNARLGNFDEARALMRRSEAIFGDLGLSLHLAGLHSHYAAVIELLAENPTAAERELRVGMDEYERMGERSRLSTTAALLAIALQAQDRDDEAYRFTVVSEESAAPDDLASQVFWRQARAQVLTRRREVKEGLHLAREAVRLAAETDFLSMHGDALVALAELLRVEGSAKEARKCAEQALELYEAKEDLVSAGKTRTLIAELEAADLDRRASTR